MPDASIYKSTANIKENMTSIPKLTVSYFPIGGRAEPIRLALALGGIPFSNKVLTFAEFSEAKSSLPLGQLPTLDIDCGASQKTLTQSIGILRYVGKIGGLYPKDDDVKAMEIDEVMSIMEDIKTPVAMTLQGAVKCLLSDDTEFTSEEKLKIRERFVSKHIPRFLDFIEKKMSSNEGSDWIVGDSMTIADLVVYCDLTWISGGILDGVPTTVLDAFPACKALIENVKNDDKVKKWYEQYSKPYGNFDYEP
jgi:glutathione S-transferase